MPARPVSTAPDAPRLIDSLVQRVTARAGADASAGVRRDALRDLLERWRPDADELELCRDGHDVLGTAYEAILSGAERRPAGQFFTPHHAADLMAAWLLREPVERLLDPAVGSGRLLYRAGIREPAPARMIGIDTDPLALALARHNLEWRSLTRRSELHAGDFLRDPLPDALAAAPPDAAIVNPPYSRHHAIPAAAKAAIHAGFEQRLGVRFSRLAALHALFLVRTIEVCAPGARIAFITPGDWLDAAYGRAIKHWVLAHAAIDALVFFPESALPFGDAVMSSGAITLLRKLPDERAGKPAPTRVVRLPHAPPPLEQTLAAIAGERSRLTSDRVTLTVADKWSRPLRRRPRGTPLGELARIRRGIATGSNAFFVVSEQVRRERELPLDVLRPCVTGPRGVEGLELTRAKLDALPDRTPRWVLACWRAEAEADEGPLGRYLRHGRRLGVPAGYLASRRTPWFGLDRREPPAILWPYFSRSRLRFVRNRAGALALNTWLGIEPHADVDADRLWRALNDARTLEAVIAARRSYAGMSKLEPRELAAIPVRWRG